MLLLGEVAAPEAPALGPLISIAVLLFAFAFVWTIRKLVQALFGWLINVLNDISPPFYNLGAPIQGVEQAITNALGKAEHEIDAAIGASWHLLARYMEWQWRELRGHATLLLEIATGIYPLAVAIRYAKALIHHLTAAHGVTTVRVKTLEREYRGIEAQVRTLEREFKGIDDTGVGKRVTAIEHEIGAIETQTIPAIQQAENDASSAINNLYEWAKGKAALLGVGTFSVAVATALDALGLGGLRCGNNPLKNKDCSSNVWGELSRALGLAALLTVAFDFADFVNAAETVAEGIGAAVGEIEGAFALELPPLPPPGA